MCYTILAEKPVPSCVALGHGVNVCPPNLETREEEKRTEKSGTLDARPFYVYIRIYIYVCTRSYNHGVCRGCCVSGVRVAKKLRVICTIRVVQGRYLSHPTTLTL